LGDTDTPKFNQFTIFPQPILTGQTVHLYTAVNLPDAMPTITGGTIEMRIEYNGVTFLDITDISLCNSTSSIACYSLTPGQSNAFSFDFTVPQIPVGSYTFQLSFSPLPLTIKQACVSFTVDVGSAVATENVYTSSIEATLAGVAQFPNPDYTQRTVHDTVQVGPIGPASPSVSANYPWGTFLSVTGSPDLVSPNFSPSGYVWGLAGAMQTMVAPINTATTQQSYNGTFYIGYIATPTQNILTTLIVTGTFALSWNYTVPSEGGAVTSSLTGQINFDNSAVLPLGWSAPITLGRLGQLAVTTSPGGTLSVSGSKSICIANPCTPGTPTPAPSKHHVLVLSTQNLTILLCLVIGVPVLTVIGVLLFLWSRQRRHYEQEEGIFSTARKPEYGNALVVDDIIQETKEHGGTLIPRGADKYPDDLTDQERSNEGSRRGRERRARSTSPSRSVSRSGSRSRSESENSEEYDSKSAGSSASR